MEEENVLKTGTTTVGIICKDGLILAADRRVTAGNMIVNKKFQKIFTVNSNMLVTMAGTVSDAQLLSRLIQAEVKLKEIKTNRHPTVKESANLLAGMVYANIRRMSMIPGISHFILGGADQEGFAIYDLFADGSITKVEDYISSGSGSVMAYGVLETLYTKDITTKEAVKLAVKALNAAMQRDNASGSGFDVFTITKDGITHVVDKDLTIVVE